MGGAQRCSDVPFLSVPVCCSPRCHLPLPVPPAKHPELSQFGAPLQVSSGGAQAGQSSLEMSRLLILRARRTFSKARRVTTDGGRSSGQEYREELEGVLADIFVQLRDMCEELAESICQRRTLLVAERVEQVEAFR